MILIYIREWDTTAHILSWNDSCTGPENMENYTTGQWFTKQKSLLLFIDIIDQIWYIPKAALLKQLRSVTTWNESRRELAVMISVHKSH